MREKKPNKKKVQGAETKKKLYKFLESLDQMAIDKHSGQSRE